MGEIAALVAAMVWSGTSVALTSLSNRTAPVVLSGLRLAFGSLVVLIVLAVSGQAHDLSTASAATLIGVIVSGFIGYGLGDTIYITGAVGSSGGEKRYSLVMPDPALYTAGALRAALQGVGITVDGAIRPGKTPANADKVASFLSPPLSEIISEMNRESINIVAELLFRDAARATAPGGQASAEAGLANMRNFLTTKVGARPNAIDVSDGSGLSTLDSLTPRTMIQLLSYAHHGPWSSAFHGSLPVAGESELLRRRMRSTPAQGNLHAKTGTTDTVIGLGGYVTAKDGEIIAFSFIYNGHDRWNAKSTMDAMGATLANFVRE